VARIVEAARTPDGRYLLATIGTERLRVRRWLADDPYPRAEVDVVAEPRRARVDPARRDAVERLLVRVCALRAELGDVTAQLDRAALAADDLRASYQAAALAGLGPFDAQRLLEVDDPAARFVALEAELADTAELLALRLSSG
jgi:Lon protease-like protein